MEAKAERPNNQMPKFNSNLDDTPAELIKFAGGRAVSHLDPSSKCTVARLLSQSSKCNVAHCVESVTEV
jgi:hypothetical protein